MHKSGYGWIVAACLAMVTMGQAQEQASAELPALRILPQNKGQLPPANDIIAVEPRIQEGGGHEMAAASSCSGKSCWQSFCDWLCYHPAPARHHCSSYVPVPRHPPLYQYFLHRAVSSHDHCPGR